MRWNDVEYPAEHFFIVTSPDELPNLTNLPGFLENSLADNEWKLKRETDVISIDAKSLKSPLEKLTKHSLLLVTGPQRVGKSTLLLCFVDECLKGKISPWRVIVFINPYLTPEDLEIVLYEVETELQTRLKNYAPKQILFAVDGLKRTGETDENCARKCRKLFEWISSHKYKLIASLRDDQKRSLEKILRDKQRDGLDRWIPLDLDEESVRPEDEFENLKKLLIKYLTCDLYKKIRVSMAFDDPEFNECVRILAEKSEGLRGYIVFLVEDIAASSPHEFSRDTVEKRPKGWIQLVWNTIRRDYFVEGDKVLPLSIIFLAKQEYPVTSQFMKSLMTWGTDVLDRHSSVNKNDICAKMDNLLEFHTEHTVFKVSEGEIIQHKLKDYIKEAVGVGLSTYDNTRNHDEALNLFSEINSDFESLVAVTYFDKLQEDLKKGILSPQIQTTWFIMADIAKMWGVEGLRDETKLKMLKIATSFFNDNLREDFKKFRAYDFLKRTLSTILVRAIDIMLPEEYDSTIKFYKTTCGDPEDFRSRWNLGQLYEKKDEHDEALKWYAESASIQNTSRAYGSLLEKLRSRREQLPQGVEVECLDLRESIALKAIECYAGEHRNWSDLAEALMYKGDIFLDRKKFGKALTNFDGAITACMRGIEVIDKIQPKSLIDHKRWYQVRIAMNMDRRAYTESRIGRLEQSIEDIKKVIEMKKSPAIGEDTHEDEKRLFEYNKLLVTRGFIAPFLESVVEIAHLTIKAKERRRLSNLWYSLKQMLDDMDQRALGGNAEDLKISALIYSLKVDEENLDARQALTLLTGNSPETGEKRYTSEYHEQQALLPENQNLLLAIIHRSYSVLIDTKQFYHHLCKGDWNTGKIKDNRKRISKNWSLMGKEITDHFLSVIPRELVLKFLELSLLLRENNIASLHNLGWENLHAGNYEGALQAFAKCMKLDEEKKYSQRVKIGIGKVHEEKKDLISALQCFKEGADLCIELYGNSKPQDAVDRLLQTAESLRDLFFLSAELVEKIEILKDVMETYNRALEISKKNNLADSQQLLEEKIKWSENLIQWTEDKRMLPSLSTSDVLQSSLVTLLSGKTDPERLETLFSREFAFFKLKEWAKSVEYAEKIVRIEPKNAFAYINKAQSLGNLRKYNEALICVDNALNVEEGEKNAFALYNKGYYLLMLGGRENYAKSIEWFDRSINSDSNYPPAWYNKGVALHKLRGSDNEEEAVKCFTKALELEPMNGQTWYNKGNSLVLLGRYNEAIECCNESLKIDPWYVKAWNMKGQCLAKLRRPAAFACNQQALSLANKSALSESDPEVVASIWDNRGYALSDVNDYEKAIQYFDKALNLYPGYLSAWQNKVYATLNIAIQGKTAGRLVFTGLDELVKDALGKIDQHDKNIFLAKIRNSVMHSFKKAVFEGSISSIDRLVLLLNDFEQNLGGLVKAPLLDEIEEACRRDEKFTENKDNVNRLFCFWPKRSSARG